MVFIDDGAAQYDDQAGGVDAAREGERRLETFQSGAGWEDVAAPLATKIGDNHLQR
tara:strand:- start:357 stop:524 length:168 start_codon:yes stop_codon:yes gene_type:complete